MTAKNNQKVIEALTSFSFESLDPLPRFQAFAEKYGRDLKDNKAYYEPTYVDWEDFDYLHDTSKVKPIYLNDFNFNLEEHREKLIKLIRMDFDTDTFESIAKCECTDGNGLRGNYLLGSNISCKVCGAKVEKLIETQLDTKVWLRLPEGVDTFINPGFYQTYFKRVATSSPKIEIITYLLDSSYRRRIKAKSTEKGRQLLNEFSKLGITPGINSFYRNADRIMEHFLIGEGRYLIGSKKDARVILAHYYRYKEQAFCKYLPVPNKESVIVERNGRDRYAMSSQLKTNSVYESVADTRDSDEHYRVTPEDIADSVDRVGKAIVVLGQLTSDSLKNDDFPKRGTARKHVASGSYNQTGRTVITSSTGVGDPGILYIPWIMGLTQLEEYVLSHLYRKGFSPIAAMNEIARSAREVTPVIDEFFRYHEERYEIIGMAGRMPSIQYLSRRSFYIRLKRDVGDNSMSLPILSASPFNAKVNWPIRRETSNVNVLELLESP